MNEINQKHQSIKLDFKFSKENYRISEQIIFHRQQQQNPDHHLQKIN